MPASKFFAYAADLLRVNSPHITDEPMIAQLKKIGIEPCKSFDMDKVDPAIRNALAKAPEEAQQLMAWKLSPAGQRIPTPWAYTAITISSAPSSLRSVSAQTFLRTPYIPLIWQTRPETNTCFISIRAARRQRTPSGRSRSTTPKASKSQILSMIALSGVIAALTFTGEAIALGIQANVSSLRVLESAFDFDMVRPGWFVLGVGLMVAALDFSCARLANSPSRARARSLTRKPSGKQRAAGSRMIE